MRVVYSPPSTRQFTRTRGVDHVHPAEHLHLRQLHLRQLHLQQLHLRQPEGRREYREGVKTDRLRNTSIVAEPDGGGLKRAVSGRRGTPFWKQSTTNGGYTCART